MAPALKDPITYIDKATPPEPDLQDIRGAEYRDQIPFLDITEREVLQATTSTPPMKVPGPDGIINRVLHIVAAQLAPHLTGIYN